MGNRVCDVLVEHLGEVESQLDSEMMDFLMIGFEMEDAQDRYVYAVVTNLLVELKDNYPKRYRELQYRLTDNTCDNPIEPCLDVVRAIKYRSDELDRLYIVLCNFMC